MKKFIIFWVWVAMNRDMLFWIVIFVFNFWLFIKSNIETDINEKNKHSKLHKWSCVLQMFGSEIGMINSFGILGSVTSLALIIQWLLLIIGLTLGILYIKMKRKENHE